MKYAGLRGKVYTFGSGSYRRLGPDVDAERRVKEAAEQAQAAFDEYQDQYGKTVDRERRQDLADYAGRPSEGARPDTKSDISTWETQKDELENANGVGHPKVAEGSPRTPNGVPGKDNSGSAKDNPSGATSSGNGSKTTGPDYFGVAIRGVANSMWPSPLIPKSLKSASPSIEKKIHEDAKKVNNNFLENMKETWKAFKETKGSVNKNRILQGVGTGIMSGDLLDKSRPPDHSEFDPDGPAILYINGIRTQNDVASRDCEEIRNRFGYQVARVENNTHGDQGVLDFLQIAGNEQAKIDITAIRTAAMIRKGIQLKGKIYIVAHSQGTKVFEQALTLLSAEEKRHIDFQGFGGEQYIDKEKHGLANARNVRHQYDLVPKNNYLKPSYWMNRKPNWVLLNDAQAEKPDYHDFRKTYLRNVRLPVRPGWKFKED